ncbi:MAG: TetR/AcrR family transcriptional regulator [Myxococcales bacterium]|nr:TetR/AcrR family transcriptional regulator [Myxococcales bacterium]
MLTAPLEKPATPRERRRLRTRERLYEVALDEFVRVGVGPAQVGDITRVAGVAYGTFYTHFENKQAVLLEASRRLAERVRRRLADLPTESIATARDFFRALIEAHYLEPSDAPELRQEIWQVAAAQPPMPDGHPHIEGIARLVAAAQERGVIRRDVGAKSVASVFLSSLLGFLSRERALDDPELLLLAEIYGAGTAP